MPATKTILQKKLAAFGIILDTAACAALLAAERRLSNWGAAECGNSNSHVSWCIERDETGKPFTVYYYHDGRTVKTPCVDREKAALQRVASICSANGLHFFHQTDPRGCALYVHKEALTERNYTNGVACCA